MKIEPKGAQREVLALEPKGHTVVLETAGSGKTTMALYLAEKLSNLKGNSRVLILTFNRALVAYMNGIQSFKDGVIVENFHHFSLGYLKSQGKQTNNVVISKEDKEKLINLRESHFLILQRRKTSKGSSQRRGTGFTISASARRIG